MIRRIVETSVRRPVSVLMVAAAVVAFGGVSLSRLTLNLLPDISYPSFTVRTELPNAAPTEVENLITRPVEEAVGVLRGLEEIRSVSRTGVSEVTLEFDWGADMDSLAMDIREKLDRLELLDEAEEPIVLRYDPALDPIVRIAVSGRDDLSLLRYIADEEVKERLERIDGVASAQVKGGLEEEIQVDLDQGAVAAMGLTPAEIANVLSASNINRPGGSLESEQSQFLVRTLNEYDDVAEIGDLLITTGDRAPVRLADVATVRRGARDREEITRVDGRECVVIDIFKEGDANTVAVARTVSDVVLALPGILPAGMTVDIMFDQSRFIESSLREVRDALLIGGALAILVLIFFLRDFRATAIIATSIPLSVIATFILMYRLDVSLNIMSLGGLTLGIGMLVDSSIVVLEAIHRRRLGGLGRREAAILGTSEVGAAVVASVLTTIAVFFPIVFVEGIAGQLFRDQSLAVTGSLMASLVVSMSLIPMLAALGRRRAGSTATVTATADSDETLGPMSRGYERFLRAGLRGRWLVLLAAAAAFAASVAMVPRLGTELIPTLTQGEFFFEVALPEGRSLRATDAIVTRMEEIAAADDRIARVAAAVGSRNVAGGLSLKTKSENLGQLDVVLENRGDEALEARVADELRAQFEQIPDLDTRLGRPSFFSLKTPVELLFFGENLDDLEAYTLDLKPKLESVAGLVDVRASLEAGNPELSVVFDRQRLARLDLTVSAVAETLQSRVDGVVASRFKEGDRLIDIRLRNRIEDRNSVGDIENLVVANRNETPVTLTGVASLEPGRGPAEIHRIQQSRAAILSAEVAGRSLGSAMKEIDALIASMPPPASIVYETGGQDREMEVSFKSLRFALLLAVFLVYLVMAATFENLVHPLLIMFTIPLALVGVVLGLAISGQSLSIIAFLGAIFLAGVVVNNAIVLVDAINRGRRDGMEKLEAVVHAGKIRLRPILMTTLTTVLGLMPMAIGFGEGAELRQPLAVVVVAGLVVSTLLTLLVVPAAYMVVPSRVRTKAEDDELEAVLTEAARIAEEAG